MNVNALKALIVEYRAEAAKHEVVAAHKLAGICYNHANDLEKLVKAEEYKAPVAGEICN